MDRCRPCNKMRQAANRRAWRRRNPERRHHYGIKYLYGLDREEYQRLLNAQHGRCALCHREPGRKRRLCVDHCHETGRVRGLLCIPCNVALGRLAETPERLKVTLRYLQPERTMRV